MNYLENRDSKLKRAQERIKAMKGFYINLVVYCIVIPRLALLNYYTTSFPWVIFPALGWGMGLTVHGLEVFDRNPLYGRKWEERKIHELMNDSNF